MNTNGNPSAKKSYGEALLNQKGGWRIGELTPHSGDGSSSVTLLDIKRIIEGKKEQEDSKEIVQEQT